MARSRLTQALDEGAVTLPETGKIALIGAPAGFDTGEIDRSRFYVTQWMRADVDAWHAAGFAAGPDLPAAEAAIVVLPRARQAAQYWIAAATKAVPEGAPVLIDGQKDNGVDGTLKRLRAQSDLGAAYSKSHGKIAQMSACPMPAEWSEHTDNPEGFITAPGVFSADAVDKGSASLMAVLPALKGRIADFGAGWGYLARGILENEAVKSLDLVETDHFALEAAKQNIVDPRASFHWADVLNFRGKDAYDAIVSNPPFHTSRKAEPALGQGFIAAAARNLARHGQFFMVANRHLPYEATLNDNFAQVEEIGNNPAFKVFAARRPRNVR